MKKSNKVPVKNFVICFLLSLITCQIFAQYSTSEKYMPGSASNNVSDSIEPELSFVISPLSWVDVQASRQNKIVTIRWTTSTMVNIRGFEIECSSNGKDWNVVIADIRAYARPGISHYQKTYTSRKQRKMVCRIRQLDYDGSFSYSPVVKIASTN